MPDIPKDDMVLILLAAALIVIVIVDRAPAWWSKDAE